MCAASAFGTVLVTLCFHTVLFALGPRLLAGDGAGEHGAGRRKRLARVLVHVGDDVLDRLEVLELVVGDLHAELVLRGHGDLNHGQ